MIEIRMTPKDFDAFKNFDGLKLLSGCLRHNGIPFEEDGTLSRGTIVRLISLATFEYIYQWYDDGEECPDSAPLSALKT